MTPFVPYLPAVGDDKFSFIIDASLKSISGSRTASKVPFISRPSIRKQFRPVKSASCDFITSAWCQEVPNRARRLPVVMVVRETTWPGTPWAALRGRGEITCCTS